MDKKEIYRLLDSISQQAHQVRELIEQTSSTAERKAVEEVKKHICPYCKESTKGERTVRGAHVKCHKKVNRAINALEITDDQAVRRGWLLAAEKGGRSFAKDQPVPRAEASQTKRVRKKKP
jgi:DNA repair exonuclease SbcCD ATPase subunit